MNATLQTLLALTLLVQPFLARPALAQEPPPADPAPTDAAADPTAGQADVSITFDVIPAADPAPPPITITEIYPKPPEDTDRHEFIELYNPTNKAVSLAYWTLSGAVDYAFPGDALIPAQGYVVVAENPGALRSRYGTAGALVYGPYSSNLSVEGEEVVLRNDVTTRVDSVTYGYGFPWPVAGAIDGQSLQLIKTTLDNEVPGAWRAQGATPAAANAGSVGNPPPFVASVSHAPQQPNAGQAATVSVVVADADGMGAVTLSYQVVTPGNYIAISDAAYNTQWTTVAMAAAGPVEGGQLYKRQLPAQAARTLVRYRVQVADADGRSVTLPYPEDPQPNFAYFVYGALPAWWGSIPGSNATFDFSSMRALPVYFFIAKNGDVTDAMHMPPSQQQPYNGSDYKWRGTFVYNGTVYDHVGFRPTGAERRFATGKTNWRFNFNAGHRFQAYDEYGRPYAVLRDKLNLRGEMGHTDRERRGEAGMFESMSYKLFELAGVPASDTNFVHYRVITGASEYGSSQYDGDFWGLYLSIENPDEQFIEEHNLPDGNLYKIESTVPPPGTPNYYEGDLNNLGRNGPADGSDLWALSQGAQQSSTSAATWWRTNVDLENYYSFRAVVEFVHHYDMGEGKNYMFYNNPETKKWAIYPWDVDLTWHDTTRYFGTGQEPWACKALGRCYDPVLETFTPYSGPFAVEYQGRLRELRDLLFNAEQLRPMLDEQAALIDSASSGPTMVTADRFKWDYNPIYGASWGDPLAPQKYVDPEKSAPGQFYKCAFGKVSDGSCDDYPAGTFRRMVDGMKFYADQRFAWIDANLLADDAKPATPTIANAGSFAADQIRFSTSAFADPQGAGTFAAMEWRIADVTAASPRNYEINATWESGVLPIYQNTVEPPAGVVQPGRDYRARVRMMDNTGRWSHWSNPLQFTAGAPATPVMQDLLLTEVMYNPLPWGNTPGDELEFIELVNQSNRTVSLGGLRVTGGIEYAFPANSIIGPNKTLVLAKDGRAFARRYGFNAFGAYDSKLGNSGDIIQVVDAWGRSVLKVEYSDKAPWPLDADGKGYSLIYSPALGAPANGASWRRSLSIGGSPGGPEPVSIVINEIQLNPPLQRAVELYNPGELEVDVSRWFLSDSTSAPRKVWLPENSKIPARGYLVVNYGQLNQPSFDGRLELDPPVTSQLVLSAGNAAGTLTGYQMRVAFPALEPGVSFGRILDSLGGAAWVQLARPTIGSENSGPRLGPLVISAINYAPVGNAFEYVELINTSGGSVDLFDRTNPQQTWKLLGSFINVPAGLTLHSGERLLAVSVPPEQACQTLGNRGFVRIIGPYTPQLSDTGQIVSLLQPPATNTGAWISNDTVKYASKAPWPVQAAGQGAALRRVDLAAYGSDPIAWQPSADLPGAAVAANATTLCSFTAIPNAQGRQVLTWALAGAPLPATVAGFKLYRSPDLNFANAVALPTIDVAETNALLADPNAAPDADMSTDVSTDVPADVPAEVNAPAETDAALANTWKVTDATAPRNAPAYYWLQLVDAAGAKVADMGQTATQTPYQFNYMPTIRR